MYYDDNNNIVIFKNRINKLIVIHRFVVVFYVSWHSFPDAYYYFLFIINSEIVIFFLLL